MSMGQDSMTPSHKCLCPVCKRMLQNNWGNEQLDTQTERESTDQAILALEQLAPPFPVASFGVLTAQETLGASMQSSPDENHQSGSDPAYSFSFQVA